MELRVLHYFLAVAREENFTKAANMLHVTQPTLSRQIPPTEGKSSEALPDSPDSISLASLLLGLRKRENNNPVQIEGVVVAVSGWSDV